MSAADFVGKFIELAAIDEAMAESPEVHRGVEEMAEEARDFWVDYWESFDHPHSREHTLPSGYVERPGDYAKSIKIKYSRTSDGQVKARITAHDYKATWIEYGSKHMPEFAPRAATVAHFGGSRKTIEA